MGDPNNAKVYAEIMQKFMQEINKVQLKKKNKDRIFLLLDIKGDNARAYSEVEVRNQRRRWLSTMTSTSLEQSSSEEPTPEKREWDVEAFRFAIICIFFNELLFF